MNCKTSPLTNDEQSITIDFTVGKNRYRRLYGGGKNQAIAKAVGIKSSNKPSIIDATAGLGADSFVLASLGCIVHMIEIEPTVFKPLQTAIAHALTDSNTMDIAKSMHLHFGNAIDIIPTLPIADVIYLDPMFPKRGKSAKVKKAMQLLQKIAPINHQEEIKLLQIAKKYAKKRVVIKRPKTAEHLANLPPSFQIIGKSCRFDIYLQH